MVYTGALRAPGRKSMRVRVPPTALMGLRELLVMIKENPRDAVYVAGLLVVAATLGGLLIAHSDIHVSAGDKMPSANQQIGRAHV